MIKIIKEFSNNISDNSFRVITVCLALCLGGVVRYSYFVSNDLFPLGDGGLFVVMINAIKANHYLLPETVYYNSSNIPFAYPPFGFYIAIIVSRLFGLPTLLVVRFLPLIINLLTIVLFVLLGSELVKDRFELLICSTIFPVIFEVYHWTIKGGGLTRAPGFLFMVTTLYFLCLYQKRMKRYYLVLAVVFLSATIMSHLEWALIAIASIFAYLLTDDFHRWKQHVCVVFILGLGSALFTFPWWGTVVTRFGITPFLMAGQVAKMDASQFVEKLLSGRIFLLTITSSVNYFIPWLAVIGVIVAFLKRDLFFPTWLLFTYIVAPKNAPISGVVPLVFLAAFGLRGMDRFMLYLISLIRRQNSPIEFLRHALLLFPVSCIYLLVIMPMILVNRVNRPILHPIQRSDRVAMEFIANNTQQDARFVVITQNDWYDADVAEWFPYLTGRQSLTTPQGLEWVSSIEFNKIADLVSHLSALARNEQSGVEIGQLVEYVETHFTQYEYVVIFVKNINYDFGGFKDTGRYGVVYDKRDVLILRLLASSE
jgi:hypothetical protein